MPREPAGAAAGLQLLEPALGRAERHGYIKVWVVRLAPRYDVVELDDDEVVGRRCGRVHSTMVSCRVVIKQGPPADAGGGSS